MENNESKQWHKALSFSEIAFSIFYLIYLTCSSTNYTYKPIPAGVQEKLGIMNGGLVYAVFSYAAARADELSFSSGARLAVLRKGDDSEREWWWCRDARAREGYVPRNLLGVTCSRLYV